MLMTPRQRVDELPDAEQLGMRRITTLLVDEFGGRYGSGVIEQFLSEFLDEMIPTATITTDLPLVAERSVRDRIRTRPPASLLPPLPASIKAATDGGARNHLGGVRSEEFGREPGTFPPG